MAHYTTIPATTCSPQDQPLLNQDWPQVLALLPADLEESACQAKALQRRREIRTAADLLRLVWLYSLCDLSLRLTGLWATLLGLGCSSHVAIRARLQKARPWVGQLLATALLGQRLLTPPPAVRLRLVDATSLSHPGSPGTDWRVHLGFDLGAWCLDTIEITDVHGAESLTRFSPQADEILLADRGYAQGPGVAATLTAGGGLVLRFGWRSLALRDPAGQPFDLLAWLRQVPPTGPEQSPIGVHIQGQTYPVRLIACRLSPQATEAARRRIRARARRKGQTPQRETFEAAGFLFVLTNLPADSWPAATVLDLYRVRWQVELAIKRLKSIWQLDQVRAKDPQLVQTYLLGKLLGAVLGAALTGNLRAGLPEWWSDPARPVSLWRLDRLWVEWLRGAILGPITRAAIMAVLSRLGRYLRDTPRKRRQQLASAGQWLQECNTLAIPDLQLPISIPVEHKMV
jgi:Transposase DDE domain